MVFTSIDSQIDSSADPATTTKIVLVVEYDGRNYYGFQLQAGQPTIQGELEMALWKLTGESTRVIAASRTDTGVHARGQVVSFRTESHHSPDTFVAALNYYLPRDIAIRAAHRVGESFNVRSHAVNREYSYYVLNTRTRSPLREGYCHHVSKLLDMDRASSLLVGEHDLASFGSDLGVSLRSTVRRVYRAEVKREGELVVFNIVASSFLPHQVRNTVGALIRVGLARMSCDDFYSIMKARKSGLAGPTAPASGLCLMQVNYPRPFEEEMR
jgi:tRNA pseudouridine38-40 synthase